MRRKWLLIGMAMLVGVLAFGAIACGDDDEDDGDGNGAAATATTAPDGGGETPIATEEPTDDGEAPSGVTIIVTENAELGAILTDLAGNTLYVFANDEPGVSNCADACATNWPPLLVLSEEIAGGEGVTGVVATIERADGQLQVAYDGAPLYYYSGDQAAGDTNGEGVGGLWTVVSVGE